MQKRIICVLLLALIALQGCQKTDMNNTQEVSEEIFTEEKDSENNEASDDEASETDMQEDGAEPEALNEEEPNSALESWVGLYRYWETFPDDILEDLNFYVRYTVRIYEEDGEYYADISSYSDWIHSESLARIEGDEETIDFLYVEPLPQDIGYYGWRDRYEKDELLLSFSRAGDTLQTSWETLRLETPYFADREDEIVGEYFEKININDETDEELSSWIGTYRYQEPFSSASDEDGENLNAYTINIYKEDGVYYADIAGRGKQLYSESLAYIKGDENAIDFFFMETLPEDARFWRDERYELNGLLLSFSRKGEGIQTSWELLRRENPVLADREDTVIGEYFKKVDMNDNNEEEVNVEASNEENAGNDLSSWVDTYVYTEGVPHPENEGYYHCIVLQMEIYEEEGAYYANITGNGWMLCTRTLARIEGDENSIDILFTETLQGDTVYGKYERYDEDGLLLSLSRKEDIIQTSWGALRIESLLLSNCEDEVIGEYFRKAD